MRKLKVWSGSVGGESKRTIVCARNQKRAVEVLNRIFGCKITVYGLQGWWSLTTSENQLAVATEEGVWQETRAWSNHYERVKL